MDNFLCSKKNTLALSIVILLACTIFVFLLTTGKATYNSNSHGDHKYFDSLQHITVDAEAVIKGKILKTYGPVSIDLAGEDEDFTCVMDYMISEVLVKDVAKGNLKVGEIIVMKQNVETGIQDFEFNEDGIMFLYDFRDLTDEAPFVLMNPEQGYISSNQEKNDKIEKSLNFEIDSTEDIWSTILSYIQ